jgi:uncharacterized protein (TIGR02300 family)
MGFQATRGAKRKCQGAECGQHFYDLNRPAFACPICGENFDVEAALAAKLALANRPAGRKPGGRYFPGAAKPLAPVATIDAVDPADADAVIDPIEGDDIEVEAVEEDSAEIANVEPILEDDDEADVVIDIDPSPEKNLDE